MITTGSDSTVVYAIAGYGYDIAGLGSNSDISYGLSQKVSSSSNFASGSSKVIIGYQQRLQFIQFNRENSLIERTISDLGSQ
jgi:hypothetical protein